jgi:Ca2+-binding RTX toxin-like protein
MFEPAGAIPGQLDGGAGVNTLDYTAFTGDVFVDLPLHMATAVQGGITNIRNVSGGKGNNLLVGDAKHNVLIGGTGRNILIGGAGADVLDASASRGDNILIGGTTDYDLSVAALDAIFAEWTRTDLGFRQRLSDLEGGSGSGANPLNRVNGQAILLTPSTVHADASPDTLTGTNQTDPATGARAHNWYFFDWDDVIVNFLISSDQKTQVK